MAFALNAHPAYPLVLLANRDEFHARPAAPSQWWLPDGTTSPEANSTQPADRSAGTVFGGRDLQAGGTWMALHPAGRLAALTNVRKPDAPAGRRSRGQLVVDALSVQNLNQLGLADYANFNLVLIQARDAGQPGGAWDLQYRDGSGASACSKVGFHGLSNAALDTPWPKTQWLVAQLKSLLQVSDLTPEELVDSGSALLSERKTWPDEDLPVTGVPLEWERLLSSCCIVSPAYGTRCSTILAVDRYGKAHWYERTLAPDGAVSGEIRQAIELGAGQGR
jgi:uncharacterized protein with NRDE domain